MASALSAGELANLRTDGQKCTLYLAVHIPDTVFTAQVNGAPSSDDQVYQLTYDGGSAGFANAIIDQTVYVGTTAGAYDKGMVRLRGTLSGTTGTMKIGEISEISWANNDHLTVVDEFALWPRHPYLTSTTVYMDRETTYSNQHASCDPVPVLGPPACAWLGDDSSAAIGFDASDSWVSGSSISTYAWVTSGGSWDDDTSATPTLTITAAGTYRVGCTLTAANTKTYTGYRYVFVYDRDNPPATAFTLESCSGDWDTGGWSFRVRMYDEALLTEIRDRALVVLFARDWYGGTETSIGPIDDRENVVAVGWVAGDSIDWNPEQGTCTFDVHGPQWWLGQQTAFPVGVEDYAGTPTAWTEFEDLTVDKGAWHLLHWQSTATRCIDIQVTGDTREISVFEAPSAPLWQQLSSACESTIFAHPCCDRYGRLFIEIDSQLVPTGDRGSIPTVLALTTADWRDSIEIERREVDAASLVDLSGVAYASGSGTAFFSLSPGHIFHHYGMVQRFDRLALSSQAQANTLAGLMAGKLNNQYPRVVVPLAANNRAIDITPHQYCTITAAAADTERGITLSAQKMVARRVSFAHDARAGTLFPDVEFESYTSDDPSADGDPPPSPPDPPDPPPPPAPIALPEPETYYAAIVATYDGQIGISTDFFTATAPSWTDISAGLPASGVLYSFDVASNGRAWLVWYVAGSRATSGLYYCQDVLDASPAWSFILPCSSVANGYFYSVGVSDLNVAYIVAQYATYPSEETEYWYTSGGSAYYGGHTTPPGCEPGVSTPPSQYTVAGTATGCVFGGQGTYDAAGHLVTLPGWTYAKCTYGVNNMRAVLTTEPSYCIATTGQIFANDDLDTALLAGVVAKARLPILDVDGSLFYIRNSDDFLMMDATEYADPEDVFGTGKTGAGFATYDDSTDQIVWLAAETSPDIVIAYTANGGTTWSDKTGDFESVCGAWAGNSGTVKPMVRILEY